MTNPSPTPSALKRLDADETTEHILARIMRESAEDDAKWVRLGIVGLSVFCVCLGILGAVAVVKSIFL